ncbi:YciI family protein [Lichenifustis flavocetrariae]|uniref:YciI family protein n=1 Tax=Lichenifustis flavocetrariae TaxID=2949735 RepID=A0AA41YR09_9HYPH|nr:YciI family protein [Lichenifustis flavocetrariae]MCW6506959.1 YciI family protein [Lichenifustis flavocetrariae]
MPYLIDTTMDLAKAAERAQVRPQHLAYLTSNASLVLAAGAKLEDDGLVGSGSFYLVELETRAAAEAFLADDPYAQFGLIASATFTRVRKGFFDHRQVLAAGTGTP